VNALLSYSYSMLTRTFAITATSVGFDGYRGFYHSRAMGGPR